MPDDKQPVAKLWGGRFTAPTDRLVEELNASLSFDARLWRYDIGGSVAHATMLGECGIIPAEDSRAIVDGLRAIEADLAAGALVLPPGAEDVHSAIEELLRERIGPAAGKLHTARSRNDQVATDLRLYLRDAVAAVIDRLRALQRTLVQCAEAEIETVLPGYTHLQHAQPVLLAHHLLAYFWMFERDQGRLQDAARRMDSLPLGAGALAGTSFPIRRERVAELLGFSGVVENSLDAVSDRDFAMEFLAAASIVMVHVSRLAEELVLWSTTEFGFIEMDDSVTTGSSIMPQKKNPDVAELARGKAGRVFGNLMALLAVMKGLPLAYNKDMQEDKEPVFDAVDTLLAVLPALDLTIATARFRSEQMAASIRGDFSTATDLADLLARLGVPFRQAHEIVSKIVLHCVQHRIGLEQMSAEDLAALAPELDGVADAVATVSASVAARSARGGTAPDAVRKQLALAKAVLAR